MVVVLGERRGTLEELVHGVMVVVVVHRRRVDVAVVVVVTVVGEGCEGSLVPVEGKGGCYRCRCCGGCGGTW